MSSEKTILSFTKAAKEKIKELIGAQDYKGVRISLKTRGCAALAYEMTFVKDKVLYDEEISLDESFKIFIQSKAVMFLIGTQLDYQETPLRSGFVFHNPQEKGKCGCGVSFYV